ncbi:MAG: Holliday junction resolvase RuvX [Pseudomonadota bacterium]
MGSSALIYETASEFSEALPDGGALLGLDLGTKTIGTATCDAGWRFATNGTTITRGKFGHDRETFKKLIKDRNIAAIVLGLPRNMDGSEGPRAQASRAYGRNLVEALGLPLLLWDERWSTQSAEAALIDQDISRAKRSRAIDSHAAAVILQGAIDRLAGGVL